jgi:hypothetical protein
VRMLGGGRPFTLEFANSRPVLPPHDAFVAAQEELNAVSMPGWLPVWLSCT